MARELTFKRTLVTNIERENDPVTTPKGAVTYLAWCEREAERMNHQGGQVVVLRKNGLCAVAKV